MITIFILFAIVVVFLIALDDVKSVRFIGKEAYNDGYNAAIRVIQRKDSPSPQELLDQVKGDDSWDKGWSQACIDNGAVK